MVWSREDWNTRRRSYLLDFKMSYKSQVYTSSPRGVPGGEGLGARFSKIWSQSLSWHAQNPQNERKKTNKGICEDSSPDDHKMYS